MHERRELGSPPLARISSESSSVSALRKFSPREVIPESPCPQIPAVSVFKPLPCPKDLRLDKIGFKIKKKVKKTYINAEIYPANRLKEIILLRSQFNAIPIKIAAGFFNTKIGVPVLKFMWKCKRPRRAKTTLKRNKIGRAQTT